MVRRFNSFQNKIFKFKKLFFPKKPKNVLIKIRMTDPMFIRTKWKRQNQLRLEQLRHQATVEKELLVRGLHHGGGLEAYCPYPTSSGLQQQQQQSSTTTTAATAQAPTTASTAAFLSTAAALFRNVTYVHGCPL